MVPLLDELVEVFGEELELTVVGPLLDLETTVGPDDELEVVVDAGVELCELELTVVGPLLDLETTVGPDDELEVVVDVGVKLCELELLELFEVVNTAPVELEDVVVVVGVDDEEAVLLPTKTGVGEELCELEAELLPV